MGLAMKPACFLAFEVHSPAAWKSSQPQRNQTTLPPLESRLEPLSFPSTTVPPQLPRIDVPLTVPAPAVEGLPDVPPKPVLVPTLTEQDCPEAPPENLPRRVPSIDALARLVKLEKYQSRRCAQVQRQILHLQVATAQTVRFAWRASSVVRALAECIRLEDKANFVSLFGSFQRALTTWTESSYLTTADSESDGADPPEPQDCYLDTVSEDHRAAIIGFITDVRHNADFLADRIASLSQKEVLALLPDHGSSKLSESVFSSSSGSFSRTSRHIGSVVENQADLLETQSYGSPLETLVNATRGYGVRPEPEDDRALGVWSSVCSRLIMEQKTGSEKLVPAILDLWAASASWTGRARLELWILQTLQAGSFLTEQPAKQTFRMRIQGRPEPVLEDLAKADRFYESAVHGLLDLLGDTTATSVIPEPVLQMSHAIWQKLAPSPTHQRGFPLFVVRRWLFSPYFSDALALPEAFGMLKDHYISEHARQRVLREVATRTLKAILDVVYSWKHGSSISAALTQRVEALMERFKPPLPSPENLIPKQTGRPHVDLARSFVVVQVDDLATMVRSLYPSRRPISLSSESETLHSGLHSSASSISGFSLFKDSDSPGGTTSFWRQELGGVPGASLQISPKPMVGATLDAQGPHTSLDGGEMLREACWAAEDATPTSSKWAVLLTSHDPKELRTLAQAVTAPPESSDRRKLIVASLKLDWLASLLQKAMAEGSFPISDPTKGTHVEAEQLGEYYSVLQHFLGSKVTLARDSLDYVKAHAALQDLRVLDDVCGCGTNLEHLRCAIDDVESRCQGSLNHSQIIMDSCEGWRRISMPPSDASSADFRLKASSIRQIRDKMWYIADVRTSAAYDEARSVTSALRIMGRPKRTAKTRVTPPLRHWSTSKLTNNNLHLKSEAQILELLSAAPEHGGPNKLSDDQARTTSQWMDLNSIENLCRGEERLHRLCMEVRKCADQLTGGDALFLANNPLFAMESTETRPRSSERSADQITAFRDPLSHADKLTLRTNLTSNISGISTIPGHLSSMGSHEYLELRSPTLTHRSSVPFWSPAMTEDQSPSSATSIGSYRTHSAAQSTLRKHSLAFKNKENESRVERLRHYLIGMLLSDLTALLYSEGSETDAAFWTGLGGTLTEKHFRSLMPDFTDPRSSRQASRSNALPRFDFTEAFNNMLQSFATRSSPHAKLNLLFDIDRLLPLYLKEDGIERRVFDTIRPADSGHNMRPRHPASPKADEKVSGFCRLFQDSGLRPQAIFRDLQYIAALVPASILEDSPQGKAFWNAAVAISDLRQQARKIMVETADSIIAYHSNNRGHGRSSSTAQEQRDSATFSPPSRSSSAEEVARYTMADAAYLLQITAKEGDPVAQRELATLYLTHPDLTELIIAPFARPRDVFKNELENRWRKNMDAEKCDPATMCVAHHWMSLSAKGGDALAAAYLRQREEMDR